MITSDPLITIIGRGHSGTRLISHALQKSGVYMGSKQNVSGDLVPYFKFYDACRIASSHVVHIGDNNWDFSLLQNAEVNKNFIELIKIYLESVLSSQEEKRGWKIPETTLCFPWIVKLFPEVKYIHWIRDPRDNITAHNISDDLSFFGIAFKKSQDVLENRAISWKYHIDIVESTPKPKNWLEIRFEDFVLHQGKVLKKIEDFLEFPLQQIEVNPEKVGEWDDFCEYSFLTPYLTKYGYVSKTKSLKKLRLF